MGTAGLPLEAGPDPGCDEPEASCACTDDTEAQSTGAVVAAVLPLPLPGTAVAVPSVAKATLPSPAWGCWGSPGAPGQRQREEKWKGQGRVVNGSVICHHQPTHFSALFHPPP